MALVLLYWAVFGSLQLLEVPGFTKFLTQLGALLAVTLAFLGWWAFNRRVPLGRRAGILAAAVAAPVVAMLLADKTIGPFPVFQGMPLLLTVWTLWLLFAGRLRPRAWTAGLVVMLFLPMAAFAVLRMEGTRGDGASDYAWRWTPTIEERYLQSLRGAATAGPAATATTSPAPLTLRPGDWPAFRGPERDSIVRGKVPAMTTDWDHAPPKQAWRRPIGAGWSSVAVVDGRLFTQEQRGEEEAVVCLAADTGAEVWSHRQPGKFWDFLSAAGPRATPTFADGRLYAQCATGALVCLDAATGAKVWARDVLADSGGKLPEFGVCSSPLLADGLVFVFAAGEGKKGLLAYRAETGDLAWAADAGNRSYASPQLATLGGRRQVLFVGDQGLTSHDPATGNVLWRYDVAGMQPRSLQPMPIDQTRLLVPMGLDTPTDLVELATTAGASAPITATKRWTSRDLKPTFNDFVVHDGHAYGFDGRMFACVELAGGARKWKKGRYGTGQVLLLQDAGLLVVLGDEGQLVLVRANPDEFEELGHFQAINGKTWNHPVYAHGRLYVRNAEEIACYDVAPPAAVDR